MKRESQFDVEAFTNAVLSQPARYDRECLEITDPWVLLAMKEMRKREKRRRRK